MMGDYPLIVNGFTFESNPESKSRLIAVAAYSLSRLRQRASSFTRTRPTTISSDLKGKLVSVPFGSAAHGMVLKAMQDRGYGRPTSSSSSARAPRSARPICRRRRSTRHADFVPFAELLPFRGFARKIFDGVETNLPTWHGVVVRTDFAEKYPEVVVAYIKALIAANALAPRRSQARLRKDPGMDRHQQGSRLHLPRPRRQHDHRSDHQAGARCDAAERRQGAAEPRPDEGVRSGEVGRRQLHPQGLCRDEARL